MPKTNTLKTILKLVLFWFIVLIIGSFVVYFVIPALFIIFMVAMFVLFIPMFIELFRRNKCPKCKRLLGTLYTKYCPMCGKKIR
ncbi:hypothetical protein HOE67_00540 [Candidatus Peregrinibacteria bacterium]|jgi:hypothetical protein|nr:hypothetical protein [Candidatus Peregrinibacteria bacterium]MBT4055577.1 hypothetical protein [Candidatus Peregrinibacteria bacterium]